jgi:hypothetical protein
MLLSVLGSLKRKHRSIWHAHVWHAKPDDAHCHLLVASPTEIDSVWLCGRWARIMNKYSEAAYAPRDAYCKVRDHPKAVLSYMLGINKNHPRRMSPWLGLGGKISEDNLPRKTRIAKGPQ